MTHDTFARRAMRALHNVTLALLCAFVAGALVGHAVQWWVQ